MKEGKSYILLVFILFLFIELNFSINVINNTITKKSVNLFGNQIDYAIFEFEFDSDIIKYDPLACPNYDCQITPSTVVNNGIDCSCDYSIYGDCPKVRDQSCTNQCPLFDEFDDTVSLCENNIAIGEPWITIEKDREYNFTSSKAIQLRYKADSSICEGLMIENYPIKGFYKFAMGYSPVYETQRDQILSNPLIFGVMNICPSDNSIYLETLQINKAWTQDTYFMTLLPFIDGKEFTMSFKLTSKSVPPTTSIIPACDGDAATILPDTHQCLNDGELVEKLEMTGQTHHYYTFKAPKSAVYTIRCPRLGETVTIMADDVVEFPSFNAALGDPPKWASRDSFENSIIVYLEKDKVLYIGAYIYWPTFYTISITSQAYYSHVNISNLPSMASMFALSKSSRIKNSITTVSCESWSQCFLYTIGVPYTSSDPISPLPPPYLTYFSDNSIPNFYDLHYDDTLLNPTKPKTYQAAFILSYKIGSATTSNLVSFESTINSKIEFLSNFFDINGNAISNIIEYKEKELKCNYNEFNNLMEEMNKIEELLYNVTDLKEMNNYRYQLDTLTIRNSYVGCTNQAINLLDKEIVKTNITGTVCSLSTNDPNFELDPCCSTIMRYKQCCNPITVEVEKVEYTGIASINVNEKCSNPSCTESIIDQFYNSLDVQDECSIPKNTLNNMKIEIITILRQCQFETNYNSIDCTTDQDCSTIASSSGKCDVFSRKCLPSFKNSDKQYLKCIFSKLDQGTIYKVLQKPFTLNDTIIDYIYNHYQKEDCINEGTINQRQVFQYYSDYQDQDRYYNSPYCLDDSCPLVHDLNYDDIFGGFYNHYIWSSNSLDNCELYGICNSDSSCFGFSNDPSISSCLSDCNVNTTTFCGYCDNDSLNSLCYNFENNDESDCKSKSYCMFANNNYLEDLTIDQCENSDQIGYCSVPCGYSCQGFTGCAILGITDETECQSISPSSTWDGTFNFCSFDNILTLDECNAITQPVANTTNLWIDCTMNSFDECIGPAAIDPKLAGICTLQPVTCKTKQECEEAGQCSDSYFFSPENTRGYPLGLGKCVREPTLEYNIFSCSHSDDPFETEQDSPMGCFKFIPNVFNSNDCEALGQDYKWWSPSQSQDQCLSQKGCKYYPAISDMLPYNTLFNHMDEDTCIGCYETNNQWTEKFQWKKGKWFHGIYTTGNWIQSKWIPTNLKTTTLDYQQIYNDLMTSADSKMADLMRSEYFCRMLRTKNNLNSISCSCSGTGGSECFKDTSLLLGQTKPCNGKESTFSFDYGEIIFSNSSVEQGCGNVLVSQFPKQNFNSVEKPSFPSNFVSYPKPEQFGVFNNKEAIIGTILGDGVLIELQGINKFNICLIYQDDHDQQSFSKYPILDFASQNQNDQKLYPLGSSSSTVYTISVDNQNYLCIEINDSDKPLQKETYFPINRIENWKEEKKSYFDQSTQGLLYTLAVLFLLVSIYGLLQLTIIIIVRFKRIITKFELVHLLILMIFIFNTVRMVYFFLLPNGYLSNSSIADYSLVVIPTFFYFSCFTIIIVLWYAIVFLVLKNNTHAHDLTKRVTYILLIVNVIIYLLLISIIIVFQYTNDNINNNCGNRILIEVKSSTSQKAVSIVYAVIQAVISLAIGSAFIYLGGNLYRAMSKAISGGGNNSNSRAMKKTKKIFLLTTICSAGFILHCIFIIVLVAIKNPSIIFSFIGLIITEIIPSLTILYCYDQRVGLQLDKTLSIKTSTSSSSNSNGSTKLNTTSINTDKTYSENLSSEF